MADEEYTFGIAVQTGGATAEMAKLEAAAKSMETAATSLNKVSSKLTNDLEQQAKNKLAPAGQVVHNAWSDVAGMFSSKLGPAAGVAQSELDKMGTSAIGTGSSLGLGIAAGAATAGAALVGFAASGVAAYENLVTATKKLMNTTGESAQQSSAMVAQAQAWGVSTDALTRSMGLFSATIQSHPGKLQQYGVEVARLNTGAVDVAGTFNNLRSQFQGTTDATVKDAMAKDLLSRGYQQLLPLLRATPETLAAITAEAKRQGRILDDKDVQTGLALKAQMTALHQSVTALSMTIGKELVPTLGDASAGLTRLIDKANSATHSVGGLGKIFKVLTTGSILGDLIALGHGHSSAAAAAALQTAAAQRLSEEETQAANASGALEKATDKLDKAQHSAASSAQGVTDAQENLAKAQRELAKVPALHAKEQADAENALVQASKSLTDTQEKLVAVQQKVSDVMHNAGQYHKDLVDAETQLARSTTSLTDAQQHLGDVQKVVNDVMNHAGQFARDQAGAQLALQHAQLNQTASAQGVQQATMNLITAMQSGDVMQMQSAQLALANAQLGTKDAAMSLTDAQTNLTNITNQAIPGTDQYNALQKQLRDAQTGVQDAATAQMNAQDRLNGVINQGIPGTREYNDLQKQLRDATDAVQQAANRERDAHYTLQQSMTGDRSLSAELADKKHAVDVNTRSLNDAMWNNAQATEAVVQALKDQATATDALALAQAQLNTQVNVFATNFNAQPGGSAFYANYPAGHAGGGSFSPGEWMTVGEKGPEVVKFGSGGTVIPNNVAFSGGGSSGASVSFAGATIVVQGVQNVDQLYQQLRAVGLREAQGAGSIYGGRA